VTDRFQIGHGFARTPLLRPGAKLRTALERALRRDVGVGEEIHWRIAGADKWRVSRSAEHGAAEMIAFARDRDRALVLVVADTGANRLALHKYVADPPSPGAIPAIALATAATRRTIRFHNEIALAVPQERPLGLYVPRPLKIPGSEYWSEHAYAAARDCGGDNAAGNGYEPAGPRLTAILDDVHAYVLANYRRLEVVDHIYSGRRWRRNADGSPRVETYTGTDRHTTHTHTAFGDHDGIRPTWIAA
jgi:hypothetical protein